MIRPLATVFLFDKRMNPTFLFWVWLLLTLVSLTYGIVNGDLFSVCFGLFLLFIFFFPHTVKRKK